MAFGAKGSFPFEVTSEHASAARAPLPVRAGRVPLQLWSLLESSAPLPHPSHRSFAVKNPFSALARSVCPAKIRKLSLGSGKTWHPKTGVLGKLCQLPALHAGVWGPPAHRSRQWGCSPGFEGTPHSGSAGTQPVSQPLSPQPSSDLPGKGRRGGVRGACVRLPGQLPALGWGTRGLPLFRGFASSRPLGGSFLLRVAAGTALPLCRAGSDVTHGWVCAPGAGACPWPTAAAWAPCDWVVVPWLGGCPTAGWVPQGSCVSRMREGAPWLGACPTARWVHCG